MSLKQKLQIRKVFNMLIVAIFFMIFMGGNFSLLPVFAAQENTIESVPDDCRLITDPGTPENPTKNIVPDSFAVGKCLSTKGQRGSKFMPKPIGVERGQVGPANANEANANFNEETSARTILINAIDIFVKLIATLSLIVFIIGAVITIVSQGKDELIDRGKNAMIASMIGLAVAMFSFIIVTFVQSIFFTS